MRSGRRIDAHHHFWWIERGDYGWLTPSAGILYRDYGPRDLEPELAAYGIDQTVLVQAAPTQAETEHLLSIADDTPWVAGVVGWLDFEAEDFPQRLSRLRRSPKFVGLRPMIQDIPDDQWIKRPKVREALRAMAGEGVPIDFLTHPRHLPHVLAVLEELPTLKAVVDHISKPPIASGRLDPWRGHIARLAALPQVYCKLSGLITEADHRAWRARDLAPFVRHAFDVFGPERVMFGSDWPVCLLAGSYGQAMAALVDALGDRLDPPAAARLFGENAAAFYGLA